MDNRITLFSVGDHREAQAVACRHSTNLANFTSPIAPPSPPTLLGSLLGQTEFDYESFARSFDNLEVATAALAARLGLPVHLLEPYDIDDGDGGIAFVDGEYKTVRLVGWTAVYYA